MQGSATGSFRLFCRQDQLRPFSLAFSASKMSVSKDNIQNGNDGTYIGLIVRNKFWYVSLCDLWLPMESVGQACFINSSLQTMGMSILPVLSFQGPAYRRRQKNIWHVKLWFQICRTVEGRVVYLCRICGCSKENHPAILRVSLKQLKCPSL